MVSNRKQYSSVCRCVARQRSTGRRGCCIKADHIPIELPDLAIYSQLEKLSLGQIPSWDNPDIVTNDWGPFRLRKEAEVKVRNLSATVPAANVLVHYFMSPFGIGTKQVLKASKLVSIGPSQEITLNFPLDQATLAGDQRAGVHIAIEHPNDSKLINNHGSQVHNGAYTTERGRNFNVDIPVLNDSPLARTITFSILPTDMLANLSLFSFNFLPYQQIILSLHIEVPSSIVGSSSNEKYSEVTVIGRLPDNSLVGGVTHLLRINN